MRVNTKSYADEIFRRILRISDAAAGCYAILGHIGHKVYRKKYPLCFVHLRDGREQRIMKQWGRSLAWVVIWMMLWRCFPVQTFAEAPEDTYCTVLMEAETGVILDGSGYDTVCAAGSLTKLMTVYLTAQAIQEGELSADTLMAAPAAAQEQKGAVIWLEAGDKMSVGDLLKGVIIGNANDAAVTLACGLSGTEQQFVMDMNSTAFDLGMHGTRFADATGLSSENLSTPQDMALLCRSLLQYEWLTPVFTAWRDFLREGATELVSENILTKNYEGLLGFKAGHGDASGYTLAVAAEREHFQCIAVVMGCRDENERFTAGKKLLAEGFGGFTVTTPDFSTEFMKPVAVRHGMDAAVLTEPAVLFSAAVPKGGSISCVVVLPNYAEAPVHRGDALGRVAFYCEDTLLYETTLCAVADVQRRSFWDAFALLLGNMFK